MRVGPAIAAMRRDRAPQLRAQAAMFAAREGWRGETRVAPVLAQLEDHGRGAALADCPALAELFAGGDVAAHFVASFCAIFAGALRQERFGQLPFRHGFDGALSTLLLARSGRARLTLVAQEPGAYHAACVSLSDGTRHDTVLAGEAEARLMRRRPDGLFDHELLCLSAGRRLTLDLAGEALFVRRVARRLVSLRLHLAPRSPAPTREYALADGTLQQQSAGDIRYSRHEMMLALLGRMKRRETAPLMAEIAGEAWPDALRWEALREALALDTASGFAALSRISRSPTDPLAAAAGALRAQLIEAHPELLAFEEAQCRE